MRILFVITRGSKLDGAAVERWARLASIPLEWDEKLAAYSVELPTEAGAGYEKLRRAAFVQRLYNSGDCEPLKVRKARG